jgi:hypothetical protein
MLEAKELITLRFGHLAGEAFAKYAEAAHDSAWVAIKEESAHDCVSGAFCWADTPEGHDYWEKIANEL